MRSIAAACIALALLLAAAGHAAVQLHVSSATVPRPGDDAEICVALTTDGEAVAGTQNDLVWDGACATLPDAASCYVAGTHAKELHGKLLDSRDFTYRGLILSLSDVDPIDDGILYCCNFIVHADRGQCCTLAVRGAEVSDPRGNALSVVGGGSARLCTAFSSATPIVTPTRTPTTTPSFTSVATDHDGCAVVAPARAGSALPLLPPALALLRRRRRRR